MATYYVRIIGNDANNGTSPQTAWRTLTKALGSSGIGSGDTLYIGAGAYREYAIAVGGTYTAETFIIGDVDGSKTGDVGEIKIPALYEGDRTKFIQLNNSAKLALGTKNFLTFMNLNISHGGAAVSLSGHDIKFINCAFTPSSGASFNALQITGVVDTASNIIVDRCIFGGSGSNEITVTSPTSTVADYNLNILISNCRFIGGNNSSITLTQTAANSFKPGGIKVINCSFLWKANSCVSTNANTSTTFPILVYNCLCHAPNATTLSANTLGNIVEDYNFLAGGVPRTNVATGPHSIATTNSNPDLQYEFPFYMGQEAIYQSTIYPHGQILKDSSLLGFGAYTATTGTSLERSLSRTCSYFIGSGTVTSSTNNTFSDSSKNYGLSGWQGVCVRINNGTAAGAIKTINYISGSKITVDGNWYPNPDTTSTYTIYGGIMSSMGVATSGTLSGLVDSNAIWGPHMWRGYMCQIVSGTASGSYNLITGNTKTTLSGSAWSVQPDSTSMYWLFRESGIGTGIYSTNISPGCYQTPSCATRESGTIYRTSPNSIKLFGPSYHNFDLAISSGNTTVSVYGYYDDLYTGIKPQLSIINGGEVKVPDITGTMTGASGQWEQISVNIFPSDKGVVTARIINNSTGNIVGSVFFDDWSVV